MINRSDKRLGEYAEKDDIGVEKARVNERFGLPWWYSWGLPIWTTLSCLFTPLGIEIIGDGYGHESIANPYGSANRAIILVLCGALVWAAIGLTIAFLRGWLRVGNLWQILSFIGLCVGSLAIVLLHWSGTSQGLRGMAGAMSPSMAIATGLFFVGRSPIGWRQMKVGIVASVYLAVLFVFYGAARTPSGSRLEAIRWILEPNAILVMCSFFVSGYFESRSLWVRFFRWVPLITAVFGAVLLQNRLMFVLIGVEIVYWFFAERRAGRSILRAVVLFILIYGLSFIIMLNGKVSESKSGLVDRLMDDTRSEQFLEFFSNVNSTDFLGGVGLENNSNVSIGGSLHVDIGYVMMCYVGGGPMTFLFMVLLVFPTVRSVRLRVASEEIGVVAGAFCYCVALTSSTLPSLSLGFCIFVLFAGRCVYLWENGPSR